MVGNEVFFGWQLATATVCANNGAAATMSPDARIHLATRIATPPEYNIAMQDLTKASAWKKAEKVYGTTADAVLRQ
jgi:hypothetical protein